MTARTRTAALLVVASGCGWMPEYEPTTESFKNSGALCFTSGADGSVKLIVTFDACLSSTCSRVLQATCRVSESAGVITISSHAATEREHRECTADCGALTARCEAPPMAPGTYTVKYGAAESELTLPAREAELFSDVPSYVTCP
jgi:hypothetical protein